MENRIVITNQIMEVLASKLNVLTSSIPNGRYELALEEVPLYDAKTKHYRECKYCPVVVYNNPKWNVGYNQNDTLAYGFWDSFSMEAVRKEWAEKTRQHQKEVLNERLNEDLTLQEKIEMVIAHNQKGQQEGWLDVLLPNGNVSSPYIISLNPFDNGAKVSKGLSFSTDIDIHYTSLDATDVPYLIHMLNTPIYWWREYERMYLWGVANTLIGVPEEVLYLNEVFLSKEVMPPTRMIGNIINSRGGADLDVLDCWSAKYYHWTEAPKEFAKLANFAQKGLSDGVINEGYWYDTVRYGNVRTGACAKFDFTLSLNGNFYEVKLYASDRGGSPERPMSWGIDLSILKVDEKPADITCNISTISISIEVIFKNLARKVGAGNYSFKG